MAKTTKTSATTAATPAATAAAATPSATPASDSAPVKVVKAPKTPKPAAAASSASASAVPVVAAAAPAVSDAAAEEPVVPSTDSLISAQFASISAKLQQVVAFAASLRSELRSLERHAVKELRTAQKASAKKRRKVGNRAPSGFVKPTPISKELAEFLGKTDGSEMARTEVTREINAYIRTNSLQDKENGRRINPDAKLKSLLKLKKGDELTYFNLQRYMSPHFAAKTAVAVTASA